MPLNAYEITKKYGIQHPLMEKSAGVDTSLSEVQKQVDNYKTRINAINEPVPEPKSNLNRFLQTLALLDRPRAALWNGLQDAATGENSFTQGVSEGWTGKEDYTGSQLMGDLGVENRAAKGILGFGAEMIADPLNLLTLGAGSLTKGLVTGSTKAMTREAAEAGAKAALKKVTVEGAEQAAKATLKGSKYTDEALQAATNKELLSQLNDVLKKFGGGLDDSFLGKSTDNIMQTATDNLAYKNMENAARKSGRGLSIGTNKHNIQLASPEKLQAIGAGISNTLKEVPVVGNVVEGVQKAGNAIWNTANIVGMSRASQAVAKGMRDTSVGGRALADREAQETAFKWAKELTPDEDVQVRQVLEGSLDPKQVTDTARRVAEEMTELYKDMAKKEELRTMIKQYFPHKMSYDYATNEGARQRLGGLTEHLKLDKPSSYMRKYRGTVEQANIVMKIKTSPIEQQAAFFENILEAVPEDVAKAYKDAPGEIENLQKVLDGLQPEKLQDALGALDGIDDYFETSAVKAYMLRALEHNKIIADSEFLSDLTSGFGNRVRNAGEIMAARNAGMDVVIPRSSLQILRANVEGIGPKDAMDLNKAMNGIEDMTKAANKAAAEAANATQMGYGAMAGTVSMGDKVHAKDFINEAGIQELQGEIKGVLKRLLQDDAASDAFINLSEEDYKLLARYFPVEAYAMPKGVIKYVNDAAGKQTSEGMQMLQRAMQAFYKLWKPTVTGLNPDYYIRNIGGNTFNEMLYFGMGALDPRKQIDGLTVSRFVNNPGKGIDASRVVVNSNGVKITAKEIGEAMIKQNAASTFAGDAGEFSAVINSKLSGKLEGNAMKDMARKMTKPLTGTNAREKTAEVLSRAGEPLARASNAIQHFGGTAELQGKATAFILGVEEGLQKGMTKEQAFQHAGEIANKYLFNYADLTDVEKNFFRNLFPFYTWARKNIPLQIESFLNNPVSYTALAKYNRNVNEANGTNTQDMPEWFQNQMPLPIPGATAGQDGRVPMVNASLPMTDLSNISSVDDASKYVMGMLNPLAKVAIENTTNQSMLTGAPIYTNEHDKRQKQLQNALNMFGVARNLQKVAAPEADVAGKAVSPLYPQKPLAATGTTQSLLKGYNPQEAANDALYAYNRQLGNEIQYLKGKYGDIIPNTRDAAKYEQMPDEIIEIMKRYGVKHPLLQETETVTVPVDNTPNYSPGYRSRYINKITNSSKQQSFEKAINAVLYKNGGL